MRSKLIIARILLGVLFLFRTSALSNIAHGIHLPVHGPLLGWPDGAPVHAALLGIVLPDSLKIALAIVRTLAAMFFLLGFRIGVAGMLAAGLGFVALAQDPFGFVFTLEVMFLAVAVYACVDLRFLDSSATLVRTFVASIYVWSAIPKLSGAWWSGEILRAYHDAGFGRGALGEALLVSHAQATAIATLVFELTLAPLLLWRRSRTIALIAACMIHAIIELVLHPDVFGWLMMILLVPFWPGNHGRFEVVHRAIDRKRQG